MIRYSLDMQPLPLPVLIGPEDKLVLQGSCFAEHLSSRLGRYHFNHYSNPNGIVFNPFSLAEPLDRLLNNRKYTVADLIFYNEKWQSLYHHGKFSSVDKEVCLENMNREQVNFENQISSARWLIITFGSAWVYTLKDREVLVANCHKIPQSQFDKRLLSTEEIVAKWKNITEGLKAVNPDLHIVYTVSPVRHLRDGVHENNLSKSVLLLAIQSLQSNSSFYFPSYELVIDDLRDYRFFDSDGAHPNELAVDYVFDKFIRSAMTEDSRKKIEDIEGYFKYRDHRLLDTSGQNLKRHNLSCLKMKKELEEKYFLQNL